MTDTKELKSWIAHAEDDFESAKTLIRRKKPLLYSVCFHAQQCAEKYMKALLILRDESFPKTHDLNTLDELCIKAGIIIGIDKLALQLLSNYAVTIRYPGDEPSIKDAKIAIEIATDIRRFARKFLGLK